MLISLDPRHRTITSREACLMKLHLNENTIANIDKEKIGAKNYIPDRNLRYNIRASYLQYVYVKIYGTQIQE
jgi:hypothetical protein